MSADNSSIERLLGQQAGIPAAAATELANRLISQNPDGTMPAASAAAVRGALMQAPITINSRDGMGRATSFTIDAATFTATYGQFGPATLSGNGKTVTYNYNAAGLYTGSTVA